MLTAAWLLRLAHDAGVDPGYADEVALGDV
jgi:hypothetical protein